MRMKIKHLHQAASLKPQASSIRNQDRSSGYPKLKAMIYPKLIIVDASLEQSIPVVQMVLE
jgi:hypothetical protein